VQSDAELVKAAIQGHREAFAELVKRYERMVYAVALDILRNAHAAQDTAQDAFVAAYQKLRGLRKPAAFGSWLLKIARHQAIRRLRLRVKTLPLDEARLATTANCDGQFDVDSRGLLAAVTKLPAHQRQVVMLRYFSGHSVREIAEITARPIGTITVQLSRARKSLRKRLEGKSYE